LEKKRIICGRNPVYEYLRSSKELKGVLYISESAHGKIIEQISGEAKRRGISVQKCDKDKLEELSQSSHDQGVVLAVSTVGEEAVTEKSLIEDIAAKKGVLVLLDQLTDPHNIGAIIRTAEALGADGVLMPRAHAPEMNATIIKSAAGATAHIPVITVANAARFIDQAKEARFWVVGTDESGTTKLSELKTIRPALVVIGSEGSGMRRLTTEKCDFIVKIPLKGKVTSLNASVAAGIVLFHVLDA
jgi:23S rRNA (guanosine2251-2'-O)-methyltransferase